MSDSDRIALDESMKQLAAELEAKAAAEEKYAQVLAALSLKMGAKIPDDLPDSLALLPLMMAMIARQNAVNQHHAKLLEKLDNLVQRVADLESRNVQ